MGRRKISIAPIIDSRNRNVTFLKRKTGLFKKAYELSVLCSADVAVIVFNHESKLYEFSSTNMPTLLYRYNNFGGKAHEKRSAADYTNPDEIKAAKRGLGGKMTTLSDNDDESSLSDLPPEDDSESRGLYEEDEIFPSGLITTRGGRTVRSTLGSGAHGSSSSTRDSSPDKLRASTSSSKLGGRSPASRSKRPSGTGRASLPSFDLSSAAASSPATGMSPGSPPIFLPGHGAVGSFSSDDMAAHQAWLQQQYGHAAASSLASLSAVAAATAHDGAPGFQVMMPGGTAGSQGGLQFLPGPAVTIGGGASSTSVPAVSVFPLYPSYPGSQQGTPVPMQGGFYPVTQEQAASMQAAIFAQQQQQQQQQAQQAQQQSDFHRRHQQQTRSPFPTAMNLQPDQPAGGFRIPPRRGTSVDSLSTSASDLDGGHSSGLGSLSSSQQFGQSGGTSMTSSHASLSAYTNPLGAGIGDAMVDQRPPSSMSALSLEDKPTAADLAASTASWPGANNDHDSGHSRSGSGSGWSIPAPKPRLSVSIPASERSDPRKAATTGAHGRTTRASAADGRSTKTGEDGKGLKLGAGEMMFTEEPEGMDSAEDRHGQATALPGSAISRFASELIPSPSHFLTDMNYTGYSLSGLRTAIAIENNEHGRGSFFSWPGGAVGDDDHEPPAAAATGGASTAAADATASTSASASEPAATKSPVNSPRRNLKRGVSDAISPLRAEIDDLELKERPQRGDADSVSPTARSDGSDKSAASKMSVSSRKSRRRG